MKKLIIFASLMMLSAQTFANYEFQHFELTQKFKDKQKSKKITEVPPIIQNAWDKIKDKALEAVNKLTDEIIDYNEDFELGEHNTPKLNWKSGYDGEFNLVIGRQVVPTLDSDVWQVRDKLEVGISARRFLTKLRDNGDIDIDDEALNLFAGVEYVRSYSYNHFAKSYKEGLISNFNKLFLSFNYFRGQNYLAISNGEVITKDDYMSADVKLSVSTPSVYSMSGYGRGSIYFSKLSTLSYHKPLSTQRSARDEAMRLSKHITKVKGTTLQIGLQADFFNLLTLTLLGSEYSVDITKTSVTNLSFMSSDLDRIKNDFELQHALNKVNRGKDPRELAELKPYLVSTEEGNRLEEHLSFFALMWGKHIGSSTEELVFENRMGKHYFFRHSNENVRVTKSWWDAIFNADNIGKYEQRLIDNMNFEYQTDDPEIPFEDIELDLPARLSFRMAREYKTKKDKNKYTKKVIKMINTFQNVDGGIVHGVETGVLKGPYTLDLQAQVGVQGMNYLITRSDEELSDSFEIICAGRVLADDEITKATRKCLTVLEEAFSVVSHHYLVNQKVNLFNLKNFLKKVSKRLNSFAPLRSLFGEDNVQMFGFLESKTKDSMNFKTYFKEGESQGHGVIKDFLLTSN